MPTLFQEQFPSDVEFLDGSGWIHAGNGDGNGIRSEDSTGRVFHRLRVCIAVFEDPAAALHSVKLGCRDGSGCEKVLLWMRFLQHARGT